MKKNVNIILFSGIILFISCAPQLYKFSGNGPVYYFNDIHPIPIPGSVFEDRFNYYAHVIPPRPTISGLFIAANDHARDVNSWDQVPASSWYIPRLGHDEITPADLVKGPSEFGPPVSPMSVIQVRNPETKPRIFIRDRRGIYYLLKMDPPNFYGIATSTSLIVNRLFWGFGYNVPEDHLFYFQRSDIHPAENAGFTHQDIDNILKQVAVPINGQYRAIASRIIDGMPLGPAPSKGVRAEDPNDLFPHQERRILRALRVFAAFTNMSEIGSDNLFDIYVGEPGKGYVKHYLIDFDDAFGTLATRNNQLWAGFNHIFNISDILRNTFTLGLLVHDWEYIRYTPWSSIGTFEADIFKPADWKEAHPFDPIQHSQSADNYWAAKILARVTDEHLKQLIEAAQYPSKQAEAYMLKTLIKRRDKVLLYYLKQRTPLEFKALNDNKLVLVDLENKLFPSMQTEIYQIEIVTVKNKKIVPAFMQSTNSDTLEIKLGPEWATKSDNYYCIKISKSNSESKDPVQFHITSDNHNKPIIAGIVH